MSNNSILDELLDRRAGCGGPMKKKPHRALRSLLAQEEDDKKEKKEKDDSPSDKGGDKPDFGGKKPSPPKEKSVESEPDISDEPSMGDEGGGSIDMKVIKPLTDDEVADIPDPSSMEPTVIDDMLDSLPSHDKGKGGPDSKGPAGPPGEHSHVPHAGPGGEAHETPLDEEDVAMLGEGLQKMMDGEPLDTERKTRITKLLDIIQGAPGRMKLVPDTDGGESPHGKHPMDDGLDGGPDVAPPMDEAAPSMGGPDVGPPKKKPEGLPAGASLIDRILARKAQQAQPPRKLEDRRPVEDPPASQVPSVKPRTDDEIAMEYYRNFDRHTAPKG